MPEVKFARKSRRTSCEVRGLKYDEELARDPVNGSHLMRGAWIEMPSRHWSALAHIVAPHARCVD